MSILTLLSVTQSPPDFPGSYLSSISKIPNLIYPSSIFEVLSFDFFAPYKLSSLFLFFKVFIVS